MVSPMRTLLPFLGLGTFPFVFEVVSVLPLPADDDLSDESDGK